MGKDDAISMAWVCTKCGECCRHVGEVKGMEEFARPDGACVFLTDDNLCSIYDNRPLICNVSKVYETFFKDSMSENDFYKITQDACDKLKSK